MIRRVAYLGLLLVYIMHLDCNAQGLEIYVSPDGNDAAAGTHSAPIKSLQGAAELAREKTGQQPVTVFLNGGTYSLTAPLRLGPEDGGTAEAPVHWKALPGENPIISGGIPVTNWNLEEDGKWSALLPDSYQTTFRSFYVNGKRATRARFPDDGYLRIGKAGKDI